MTLRRSVLRGTVILSIGEVLTYGLSFGRNMILARMLTKADFGIAVTFAMVLTILEFAGKMAIGRFVIQDKEGDTPRFMATAQLMQFVASVFSAVMVVAFSRPLAALFDIQGDIRALQFLAVLPLMRGFEHLDFCRQERELQYVPSTLVSVIPHVVITLAVWPVATWVPDYRAVLILLALRGLGTVVVSQVLAERPFRFGFDREIAGKILRFGWPLILNAIFMFGVFQGDQFLVASFYTMSDLGAFSAAASLALAPSFVFARILSSVMLPLMSKAQDNPVLFAERYRLVSISVCALSATYAVTTIIGAEALMQFAFGAKYAGTGLILGWLGAANAYRIIRVAPAIAALAKADSHNQMISNLSRVTALVPALAVALAQQPLWMVAMMGLLGEALAAFVAFRRLSRRDGVPWSSSLIPSAMTSVAIAGSGLVCWSGIHQSHPVLSLAIALAAGLAAGSFIMAWFPETRAQAAKLKSSLNWRGLLAGART